MSIALVDFWYWWIDAIGEIFNRLLPFNRHAATRLTIEVCAGEMVAFLRNGSQNVIDAEPFPLSQLPARMTAKCQELGNGEIALAIVMKRGRFVLRHISSLTLPRSKIRAAAALDLSVATPFKAQDVYIFAIENGGAGSAYAIVKKSILEPIVVLLRAQNLTIDYLSFEMHEGIRPIASFDHGALRGRASGLSSYLFKAVAGALTITIIATAAHVWVRNDRSVRALNAQVKGLASDAKAVRQMLDKRALAEQELLAFSKNFDDSQAVTGVWEELARIIPDSAYLTDLDIKGHNVAVTGYATHAAALLVALEQSAMFSKANFTAPVVKSPGQSGERFQISLEAGRAD